MKNIFSQKSISGIFAGALIVLCLFASCDNFLNSGAIKEEIQNTIAYNNASEIQILIQPVEGTGSCVPTGNNKVKKGYDFEISFSENPAYSFIKWTAVTNDNAAKAVTEGIEFEDATSPKTKVKISNDTVALRLLPVCEERIAVSGEPSPRYDTLGVSRDRSISVSFTKPLAESSFIFEESEVPAGAQRKKDFDGKIWAYTFEGKTYLKNVSITNNDDYSIAEHFTRPTVSGKLLVIGTDRTNPIEFNVGEVFKTVKVTLSKDITDTSGIKMNASKSWNYQITESTDEKATVNLTSVAVEGSVYLAGQRDYSLGQKLTLAFTEDADYQFVKWDYDPLIVYVADPESKNTTATVIEKTTEEQPTQIKAVCAHRLRVTSFDPKNDSTKPYVSKNSSIVIVFNQNIPNDDANKNQLKNIMITMGGTPVKSSFKDPVINSNTITFIADNSNMLDVPEGQKKTVSVTIPADFYYTLSDGTKVTYGGNGISFDYKIDDTTLDKAEITLTAPANSGEFTAAKGTNQYSLGQEVAIAFKPNDGWQFNGWIVKSGNDIVPDSQIKIADKNALSTKLYVYEAVQGVTVMANASETLSFTGSPSGTDAKPKDSDIVITFNKPLADECRNMLDKILISSDGNNVDSYYTQRTLSSNVITIKNTTLIAVSQGSSKIITVTVPGDFYYSDGSTKINLVEKSFSFTIDYTTNAKAKVTYRIKDGETGSLINSAGSISDGNDTFNNPVYYNIDEKVPLAFTINPAYKFYGWEIIDSNNDKVTNKITFDESNSTDLNPVIKMNESDDYEISAICYKRPLVSTNSVSPYNSDTAVEVAKNTPIVLTFDHPINPETKDNILVTYSVSNFSQTTYFSTSISSDNKTVTLMPSMMLPLNNAYETVTVTVPHDNIYYLARDGKTQITPAESDFTWSYKVNNTTVTKTTVVFETTDAAVNGRQISVGGTYLSSGVSQSFNEEQSVELEFPVEAGYEFAGWKITPVASGYTCNSDTYTKSGKIEVKNGETPYLTLSIDASNPAKAILTSSHAIVNGVKVSAKDALLPIVESVKINDTASIFNTSSNICDSRIYFHFNKYIAVSSVTCSSNGSITITKNGSPKLHYEDYFTTSWADADNNSNPSGYKTLIISPKNSIKELVPNTSDEFDFVITLNANSNKIRDTQTYALQSSASINNSFEIGYKISGQRETEKPSIEKYNIYNKVKGTALVQTSYEKWDYTCFTKNHLSKSLYFEILGNDEKSGIKHLRVSENHYDNAGEIDGAPFISYYYPETEGVKSYSFANTHKFIAANDGLIRIDFEVVDMADNASTVVSYYVIKDTAIIINDKPPKEALDWNFRINNDDIRFRERISETEEKLAFDINDPNLKKCLIYGWEKNLYLKIIWSYDETTFNEKTNLIERDKGTGLYTFVHNPLKNTYFKVVIFDDIGNEATYIRFIPACPDFSENAVIYDSQYDNYLINPGDLTFYRNLIKKYDCPSGVLGVMFYKNNNLYTDNEGREWCKKDKNDPPQLLTYIGGGIKPSDFEKCKDYYINIRALIGIPSNNPDERFFESVISDTTLLLQFDENSNISKKIIGSVKKGAEHGEPIHSVEEVYGKYPDFIEIAKVIEKPNTGNCDVLIKEFTTYDEFDYQIRTKNTDSNTFLDFPIVKGQKIILDLPTPARYDMQLVLTNKNNGVRYITSSILKTPLELKADCTAPVFKNDVTRIETLPSAFSMRYSNWPSGSVNAIISGHPIDETGMYKNDDGLGELEYWILPNYATVYTQYATYTEKELMQDYADYKKIITYDYNQMKYKLPHKPGYNQSIIEIPLDGLDEGLYTIAIKGKDKAENYSYYFQPLYNRLLNEKLLYSCPQTDKISFNNPHDAATPESVAYFYFDNVDNNDNAPDRWIYVDKSLNIHNSNYSTVSIPDGLNGRWCRLVGFKAKGQANPVPGYYDVEYMYMNYWRYKGRGTPNEIFVKQKNVIPGLNGLQIYCDQPTLVHTLYCSKKLSETAEEEDIAVWENKGMETGVVINNELFTYSKDYYYKTIPSGYYYTTVIHFADGTKVMTEVQKKP